MFFEKEDVDIYYEVRGEGQPMLMVHGAAMDADWYQAAAEILAKHYQVITYDRRGSSRSKVKEGAAFDLDTQVQDIKDLLDHLQVEQTVIVGASAGAIATHRFLTLYPERVDKVILYEPAVVTLLEGTEHSMREWVDEMENLIARKKINSAMFKFVQSIGDLDARAPEKSQEASSREMYNLYHFLPNEYEVFVEYRPDPKKTLEVADKTIVAVGEKSGDSPYATAARCLAKMIGKEVLHYPGLHNAPYDVPKEFAICVLGTLLVH